jgi:hypothetical protein
MALPFTTHSVFVVRPALVPDAHGNRSRQTKDWKNAPRLGPYAGVVQPDAATLGASLATRENDRGGREQVETTVRVWLNPGVDVLATDGVEVDGLLYDIDGDPLPMADPIGGGAHIVLKAVRVRG